MLKVVIKPVTHIIYCVSLRGKLRKRFLTSQRESWSAKIQIRAREVIITHINIHLLTFKNLQKQVSQLALKRCFP